MRLYENKTSRAVAYLRLSREDGDKIESDSIGNQRTLIQDYVQQHKDITLVDEYIDDGYSGANFERPGFQRMIEDLKKKQINCIIVKDLSRFGRNYIEAGRYLERIFPYLGIRFVSVNDQYDSAHSNSDADQIIIPFKNLLNDAYCRDLSIKIKSQFDVKRKNGQYVGSFTAYGYRKDPIDKHHLMIDEYAAEIVKMIYDLKLEGMNSYHIAKKLNEMGVLTPMEYKRSCGHNYHCGLSVKMDHVWDFNMVNTILKNEIYTGTMVQGKNKKVSHKVKRCVAIDPSEWIRVDGTHDAIIEKDIFNSVQELLKLDTRTAPENQLLNLLSGFLRCGDCGENMVRRSAKKNGKMYYYYHCTTYKNRNGCTSHLVSEEKVTQTLIHAIKQQVDLLVEAEEVLKNFDGAVPQRIGIKTLNNQLIGLESEISKYSDLKGKLYQDKLNDLVTQEEYLEINARFSRKINTAKKAKEEIETKRLKLMANESPSRPWIEEFKKHRNIQTLDRKTLITLIERIIIHDKERIEIVFKHHDEMMNLVELMEMNLHDTSKNTTGQEEDLECVV